MIKMREGRATRLVLLVGSNPLPNYLSACALRPTSVAFVYTRETATTKERLQSVLERTLGENVTFEESSVENAACATEVRRALDAVMPQNGDCDVLLNYTGGTKVMAVHARMAFSQHGSSEHASYLHDGGRNGHARLCFDDGKENALSDYDDIPFNLATVLALHGIEHTPRMPKSPSPTTDDTRGLLCKVLADHPLAAALYCERERLDELGNPNKATSEPFRGDRYGLSLSLPEFPTIDQLSQFQNRKEKESWFQQWYKFIGGEWLEYWVGEQIRALAPELGIDPNRNVTVGVNAKRIERKKDDPPMEIDIAVIRGFRSYFISCTTDATKHLCKAKLFEIDVRSRQLGGDLARAALVCLADDATVAQLQHDIQDAWDSSNTAKIFGRSDIAAWGDCNGKQSNRHSLKEWLES